jgi:hypothetical protein
VPGQWLNPDVLPSALGRCRQSHWTVQAVAADW